MKLSQDELLRLILSVNYVFEENYGDSSKHQETITRLYENYSQEVDTEINHHDRVESQKEEMEKLLGKLIGVLKDSHL